MRLFVAVAAFFASALLPAGATITLLSGTPSTVEAGDILNSVRVQVLLPDGRPAVGVRVSWTIDASISRVHTVDPHFRCPHDPAFVCFVTTDSDGRAYLHPLYALSLGRQALDIHAQAIGGTSLGTVRLELDVVPLTRSVRMTPLQGVSQVAVQNSPFPQPFRVRVEGSNLFPIPGHPVTFRCCRDDNGVDPVISGNSGNEAVVLTDNEGVARAPTLSGRTGIGMNALIVETRIPGTVVVSSVQLPFFIATSDGRTTLSLQDMWWLPRESGWGLSVIQHHDRLFSVLFAYDRDGRPTWKVIPEGRWNSRFQYHLGPVYAPRGAPFYAYDPLQFVPGRPVEHSAQAFSGERFTSLTLIQSAIDLFSKNNLVRQDFSSPTPLPLKGLGDMWWGGPSQAGWGMAIQEQPGGLFIVWFTYGADGNPTWFVMPSGSWTRFDTYEGTIYRTEGPTWPQYDASLVKVHTAGTFRFHFLNTEHAQFSYGIGPHAGTMYLERQPF